MWSGSKQPLWRRSGWSDGGWSPRSISKSSVRHLRRGSFLCCMTNDLSEPSITRSWGGVTPGFVPGLRLELDAGRNQPSSANIGLLHTKQQGKAKGNEMTINRELLEKVVNDFKTLC